MSDVVIGNKTNYRPLLTIDFPVDILYDIIKDYNLDERRISIYTKSMLRNGYNRKVKPSIEIIIHNEQYQNLEGNHRILSAYMAGIKTIPLSIDETIVINKTDTEIEEYIKEIINKRKI